MFLSRFFMYVTQTIPLAFDRLPHSSKTLSLPGFNKSYLSSAFRYRLFDGLPLTRLVTGADTTYASVYFRQRGFSSMKFARIDTYEQRMFTVTYSISTSPWVFYIGLSAILFATMHVGNTPDCLSARMQARKQTHAHPSSCHSTFAHEHNANYSVCMINDNNQ